MANSFRLKRRASPGGAPSTLLNGEVAFNETDQILWYGTGDSGVGGIAVSIIPIGGRGFVPWLADVSTANVVTNDVATVTSVYPTWVGANTGNLGLNVSSAKLSFVPSTGTLTATAFSGVGTALTVLTAGNLTGTIPSTVLGNSTVYIGTTAVVLNRSTANLALTGITSISFPGSGSGTAQIVVAAAAGTPTLTLPLTTGSLVSTGDTAKVTNTMLVNSSVTVGTTAIALGASSTTLAGLTNVTSTVFTGRATALDAGTVGSIPYQSAINVTSFLAAGASSDVLVGGVSSPAWLAKSSLLAGKATSIDGGAAGQLHYQSGVGTTAFVSAGTASQVLVGGASIPVWTNMSAITVGKASHIAGAGAGQIHYQSAADTTAFLANSTVGHVLGCNGGTLGPSWINPVFMTVGACNNLTGGTAAGQIVYQGAIGSTSYLAAGAATDVLVGGASAPAWLAKSSLVAGKATSLDGGSAGQLHYQSGVGTTSFLTAGASTDVLVGGASAPAWLAKSSLVAGKATSLDGGSAGQLHYQSGVGTTSFLTAGASTDVLQGGTSPSWIAKSSLVAGKATSLGGGAAGQIHYQSAADTTAFLTAGAATQVLIGGASAPAWTNISGLSVATAVNATQLGGSAAANYALLAGPTFSGTTTVGGTLNVSGSSNFTVSTTGTTSFTGASTKVAIAADSAGYDAGYAPFSVTRGTGGDYPYISMVRSGSQCWQLGITTSHELVFATLSGAGYSTLGNKVFKISLDGGTHTIPASGVKFTPFSGSNSVVRSEGTGTGAFYVGPSATSRGIAWDGTNLYLARGTNGWIVIGDTPSGSIQSSTDNVTKPTAGGFTASSDERLKIIHGRYTLGLDAIKQLSPIKYSFNDHPHNKYSDEQKAKVNNGFSAQELLNTQLSSMVSTDAEGFYTVDITETTYALINAVKELSAMVDKQAAQIELLLARKS